MAKEVASYVSIPHKTIIVYCKMFRVYADAGHGQYNTKMATFSSKTRRVVRTQAERSETTRRRILDSAVSLIRRQGFQKANLLNIATGAKVTLGALQHQFGTRQALLEQVVEEVMAPLSDNGPVWPDATIPLGERASEFVKRAWQHIYGADSYVAAWGLFFGCKSIPSLFKRIDAKRQAEDPVSFAHFLELFPEISANHNDPEGFAEMVFSTLRGIAVFKLFPVKEKSITAQLECLAGMIVAAARDKQRKASRP